MFLVTPNGFYSYLGTSVGPSQIKILYTSYYQKFLFELLFFQKNLKHVYFFN